MVANLWVAASDGDINAVKGFIESGEFTANSKDANGYTPIHAAVSYRHTKLLKYLIEKGGDINIQDTEGDSPLHHVEDVATAKLLVEQYKADFKLKNQEGQTAADYIAEDDEFPEVVQYLRSLNHDNPQEDGAHILDTLPKPEDFPEHNIRYSYENQTRMTIDIDDEKRQTLREIVEGENPEEKLTEFLKNAVHQQLQDQDAADEQSPATKRRRD